MGSAVSTRAPLKAPIDVTSKRKYVLKFDDEDVVNNFAKEIFMVSPKIDALQHVLSTDRGRTAFMDFLLTEYAEENLSFFIAVDTMKKSIDSETLADQAFDIASKYLQPGVSTELNISGPLRDSINSIVLGEQSTTKQNLFNAFDIAQNEAIKMMAMGAFPRFLSSDAFIRYRALDHISDTIVRQKMSNELDRLLDSTSWLSYLLASVEHLPICVSLAAASKQTSGFPLIYVNACFEKTTGYPRDEIIGQNCRFLQMGKVAGHVSEGESISRMSAALRDGKESKVVITNFRKDGTPFRNLLAMKPILDQNGEYAFVLGVQFDIGDKDANPDKMRIVDDLFRVLPSVIICNAVTDAHVLDVIKVI